MTEPAGVEPPSVEDVARWFGVPPHLLVKKPRCVAHGDERCTWCAQNPSGCAAGADPSLPWGCDLYATTGMHWDTCPNRIRTAPPGIEVRKMVAYVPISDELLHPERYPAPVITRRTRLRWWWWEVKDRVQLAWAALRSGRDGVHCDCDY